MNIQETSKVIAITKDQAHKMNETYNNALNAMVLPSEPVVPTPEPAVEPLTIDTPVVESGVTNADIITQTESTPVVPAEPAAPVLEPAAVSEETPTIVSDSSMPNLDAMSAEELRDEMIKIENEINAKNAKAMDLLDEINADLIYHKELLLEYEKKLGLNKETVKVAPVLENTVAVPSAEPINSIPSQEVSPFAPDTTVNMFDVPSGKSL